MQRGDGVVPMHVLRTNKNSLGTLSLVFSLRRASSTIIMVYCLCDAQKVGLAVGLTPSLS